MDGLSPNLPPRDCTEEAEFIEAKGKLKISCERLDDILSGIGLSLCRNPERYPIVIEGTQLRIVRTDPVGGNPSFLIYYTFDDERVHLLYIEEAESETF